MPVVHPDVTPDPLAADDELARNVLALCTGLDNDNRTHRTPNSDCGCCIMLDIAQH